LHKLDKILQKDEEQQKDSKKSTNYDNYLNNDIFCNGYSIAKDDFSSISSYLTFTNLKKPDDEEELET